jgi:hypothetical protein
VIAEVDLVVCLEEASCAQYELRLAVAFEARARDDVEDAIGAVADIGGVTAALDFDVVDVFRVDLCAKIAGDVCVRDLDSINEPAYLMASAHVEHIVRHVGSRNVVSNHGETAGAVGAGRLCDVLSIDECGWGYGVHI